MPLASVTAVAELRPPQGAPVRVKVTVSPETTAPPTPLVTTAFNDEVVAPSAGRVLGVALRAMLLGTAFWTIATVLELPPLASVAVIVQVPAVVETVYVTLATPLVFVVAEAALRVPQTPAAPLMVNETRSLAMPFPLTVAVIVEVLAPSAGKGPVGLAVTAVVLVAVPRCVIPAVVLLLVPASVAVIVQKPTVVLAV